MKNRYFSVKDVVLMAVFGCVSSLTTLTTAFIPAPLPGLYAIIAIPVSTVLILTVVEIVGKFGAATFTQLVSGAVSMTLPSQDYSQQQLDLSITFQGTSFYTGALSRF